MSEKLHAEIMRGLGKLEGKVDLMLRHQETQNGNIAKNTKDVQRHEVVLGKIGAVLSGAIFLLTILFNTIISWFKNLM